MRVKILAIGAALLGLGTLAFADEYTKAELRAIGEGRALYVKNCAGCHGALARGVSERPAPAPGPDLTVIVVRDGGFEANHVRSHILFGDQPWYPTERDPGHMPAWGRALRAQHHGNEGKAACDVAKMIRYLEFIQATE
jgi:mono/diheme cytochrome c family protein